MTPGPGNPGGESHAGQPVSPQVAAFDFDGTLLDHDCLPGFFALVAGRIRFAAAVAAEARSMLGVVVGRVDRDVAKARMLERIFAGRDAGEIDESGARYAARLVPHLRPEMIDRLERHRAAGHRLVVVSASLDVYLRDFKGYLGLDEVMAVKLEVGEDGLLTGRMDGPNVRGPEKVVRLRRWIDDPTAEIWAYGDSRGDRELLMMADHPTVVGSTRNLKAVAGRSRYGLYRGPR